METLEKNSGIIYLKSKFFIYRIVTYFTFLLLPVYIQKTQALNQATQVLMMIFYMSFMVGQWFLLGKEIDHRFKIYFRVNSSIDRVVYRLIMGMSFFVLYFNFLSLFPSKWIYNLYWTTWVVLGLFYSWPTRGKIIQESVSTNFGEFKYLDRFEKTLLGIIILIFIFSIPELPALNNFSALKLFFDPKERINAQYWNFLTVGYYPFKRYPELFKVAFSMHFYFIGLGIFLIAFYAFLRYFVSRRLSLLGVFALVSSWSFSKILSYNFGHSILATFSLIWIWSFLWVTKSSTYRSGLFLGLVGYLGSIINSSYALLIYCQLFCLHFVYLSDRTPWFKKQLYKYSLFGIALMTANFIYNIGSINEFFRLDASYLTEFMRIMGRKSFYSLSIFGAIVIILKLLLPNLIVMGEYHLNTRRIGQVLLSIVSLIILSFLFDSYLVRSFSIMWFLVFFSLFPLEILFQNISKLRSRRNMIYLIYILVCLLDSHFEGRIKIFLRMF